ncbi:MAG: polyprenyl synthetase family protein, partial [Acidaminococcaceae bacterium]|nr:polyprenyl synthetase family protein [Acidaminococcaceae bacterium]
FGEAMALLAGDGLLTLAFEVMLEQRNVKPSVLVEVVHETAMCAGNFGMVGGQALDLDAENRQISAKELKTLHEGKTGAMFIAAVRGGAHLAGATDEQLLALTHFAELVGLAFQIQDDILDVTSTEEELGKPIGSDEKNHKSTYVSLYGLETAKKMAEETTQEALGCLDMFGEKAEPLREIAKMMCNRKN